MQFEWDKNKNKLNIQKHGISFNEAKTVFNDVLASIFDDSWNSIEEHRELIIGSSDCARLLIISFTERTDGVIRIISARIATNPEIKNYERADRN
ncbi:MAG: BrnT family toxin [Methylococcaceae bacterium]